MSMTAVSPTTPFRRQLGLAPDCSIARCFRASVGPSRKPIRCGRRRCGSTSARNTREPSPEGPRRLA